MAMNSLFIKSGPSGDKKKWEDIPLRVSRSAERNIEDREKSVKVADSPISPACDEGGAPSFWGFSGPGGVL
jgi:hypothetical protein